jgi:hypothetical protein
MLDFVDTAAEVPICLSVARPYAACGHFTPCCATGNKKLKLFTIEPGRTCSNRHGPLRSAAGQRTGSLALRVRALEEGIGSDTNHPHA